MPLAAFQTFGGQHLLLLGVFAVGLVGVVLLGRVRRGLDRPGRFDRGFAIVLVVAALSAQAFQLTPVTSTWAHRCRWPCVTSRGCWRPGRCGRGAGCRRR